MVRLALAFALLLPAVGCAESRETAGVTSRFVAGQVWKYKTRTGEERSRARVTRVELHPKLGVLVHVYIDGLKIENPRSEADDDLWIRGIVHMPLTEQAMEASATELEKSNQPIPLYERGYERWRRSFLAGEATVFQTTIAENIDHFQKASYAESPR